MSAWQPDSWQAKPALQQPTYPDMDEVAHVVTDLAKLPPLVTSWEVENLKQQLAEAARGHRFLLQGGDCAEVFDINRRESRINFGWRSAILQGKLAGQNMAGAGKRYAREESDYVWVLIGPALLDRIK